MLYKTHPIQNKLVETILFIVLAGLLVSLHYSPVFMIWLVVLLSIVAAFYRPVIFIYLLIMSTLFAPELSIGPGFSPNILIMAGFNLAVFRRMMFLDNWTLPKPRYASIVLLFAIVGIISLLKSFIYFNILTIALGALYLGQWILYLLLPVMMAFYLEENMHLIRSVLSFTLLISFIFAIYLSGLFFLDIRPTDPGAIFAGYRPLVAFWRQSQTAVGGFTALSSLVSLGIAIKSPRKKIQSGLFVLSALFGFLTIATLSRSAILGLIFGGFIIVFLEYRWQTLLVLVITIPLGVFLAPEWLIIRFTRSTFFWHKVPALGIKIPIGTLWKRLNGWVRFGEVIVNNPLFGIGFSLSQERMAQLFGSRISPDNQYVALLAETGLVGFIVFGQWVRQVFWRIFKTYRYATQEMRGLALGMIGAFSGILLWAFFGDIYARWRVLGSLFIYIGLVYTVFE